jgi:beta-aspartyl-peptidase (threonine type)
MKGVRASVESGYETLTTGGSSVDAVERAVVEMEDTPVFNAGVGSALNLVGETEMDAGIMDGSNLRAGTVAIVTYPKNPIRLARLVMEKTQHVTLAGRPADTFARIMRLEPAEHRTRMRTRMWRQALKETMENPLKRKISTALRQRSSPIHETVGALAVDSSGNLAAATSTGGSLMKLPGRVGDTAIIGAGCYANNRTGAATVTGLGETAMRFLLSKFICDRMASGRSSQRAAEAAMRLLGGSEFVPMGAISIDRHGRIGAAQTSKFMPWAFRTRNMPQAKCMPKAKIIRPSAR